MSRDEERVRMVERQLASRGITDPRVLAAFETVPREQFVPTDMVEFAYRDSPLPIGLDQTISQPYIVALTVQALQLQGHERVLEIGTGSGYAAAILSMLAREVFTVERLEPLAEQARARFRQLGYDNIHVLCGDGTLGWPEHAPFDAIAVAAGGPEVPAALRAQLAQGGRLVIPVGSDKEQVLKRIVRESGSKLREEALSEVRFVPLIGAQGWPARAVSVPAQAGSRGRSAISKLVRESAELFEDESRGELSALRERIGGARVVLMGESSHGTSEFYLHRARITRELIQHGGFDFVAVEADWPDAQRVHEQVVGTTRRTQVDFTPFSRFPTWMWRNREVSDFVSWLRAHNQKAKSRLVGFHGLDLYSMFTSMALVLEYLDRIDADTASVARARYGLLTPWQSEPAAYGRAVLTGRYESSERAVLSMLGEMLAHRFEYARRDGERYFDAAQNARVVAAAEHYYRAMYYQSAASWNLRDTHMFETLQSLLAFYGPNSRGIVWAHNSHIGDASATELSARGELNIGQLCRSHFGDGAYSIGFGTDHGTVAAASQWDGAMQVMRVRPARSDSYERICHDAELPVFSLHLRNPRRPELRDELMTPRLERAIGVIYRPESERASHYFQATLPRQFDEYVWFDQTSAVSALPAPATNTLEVPETYPFGV